MIYRKRNMQGECDIQGWCDMKGGCDDQGEQWQEYGMEEHGG